MSTPFEIPLVPGKSQKFAISLNAIQYSLLFKWVDAPDGGWTVDILDSTGAPIIQGVPLVTGADLLAQYGYLDLGGSLIVQTDGDQAAVPTFNNLGQASHLYYVIPTP